MYAVTDAATSCTVRRRRPGRRVPKLTSDQLEHNFRNPPSFMVRVTPAASGLTAAGGLAIIFACSPEKLLKVVAGGRSRPRGRGRLLCELKVFLCIDFFITSGHPNSAGHEGVACGLG